MLIFRNLPPRGAATLMEILERPVPIEPAALMESHEKIQTILADLKDRGSIQQPS
jgi:hypothetical protein